MRTLLKISTFLLLLSITLNVYSQETIHPRLNEITFGIGISKMSISDNRFSARRFTSIQPRYHFGYLWQSQTTRQALTMDLIMNNRYETSSLLDIVFIEPKISYSFQKRSKNLWIGGVINSTTLLNFPRSTTGHFSNNPISYSISNSVGPKISIAQELENSKISLVADLESSFLAYVIRPAYGHPYPNKYLESGTFQPTRDGMAGSMVRSGKIMSLGKFNALKLVFGISYLVGDHVKLGLHMTLDHYSVHDTNVLSATSTDILFTTSYVY